MRAFRQRPRAAPGRRCRDAFALALWLGLAGLAGTARGGVTVSRSLPTSVAASGLVPDAAIDIVVTGAPPNGLVIEEELPPGWTVASAEWTGLRVTAEPVLVSGRHMWLFDPLGLAVGTGRLTVTLRIPDSAEPGTYAFSGRAKWLEGGVECSAAIAGDSTLLYRGGPGPWLVQFNAGEHGTLLGPTVQTVDDGASALPVTAEPAYGFVFQQWSDGSTENPRVVADVHADVTLTASFRAAVAMAPEGSFVALTTAEDVAGGRGWWDLTGSYRLAVAGFPLTLDLLHDTAGGLSGAGALELADGTVVPLAVAGKAKGQGGTLTLAIGLRGTRDGAWAKLSLRLTLDSSARQLVGVMTGAVGVDGTVTPADGSVNLELPAAMDGTWSLRFDLTSGEKGVSGRARLALSNSVAYGFAAAGYSRQGRVALRLIPDSDNLAARSVRITTTITPLIGGWAALQSFRAEGYGQALAW
jgi:hypothetical protein